METGRRKGKKMKRIMVTLLFFLALATVNPLTCEFASAGIITNGLIGYWAAEGNAEDSSPTANHGTFSGTYVPGINGQAFNLANYSIVSINDNSAYSFTDKFSVGFWFNMAGKTTGVFLGQDEGGGSYSKWFIDYNMYNPGGFDYHFNNGLSYGFIKSNYVTLAEDWNQFTLVRDGDLYSFYLNGHSIGTQVSSAAFPDPTAPLRFGFAEPGHDFLGYMDDVVLYNRALTASEVQVLAAPVPIPGAIWLLGSGLVGLVGLKRKFLG